jgi:hypothetical protein
MADATQQRLRKVRTGGGVALGIAASPGARIMARGPFESVDFQKRSVALGGAIFRKANGRLTAALESP